MVPLTEGEQGVFEETRDFEEQLRIRRSVRTQDIEERPQSAFRNVPITLTMVQDDRNIVENITFKEMQHQSLTSRSC